MNVQSLDTSRQLFAAVKRGDAKALEGLVSIGTMNEVISQDEDQNTLLIVAAENGDVPIMKLLLGYYSDQYWLYVLNYIDLQGKGGFSALMAASRNGHTEIVEMLLSIIEIDVNLRNSDGCTALISASGEGHTGIVNLLLAVAGIDVLAQDNGGRTAFMCACERGKADTVKTLLLAVPSMNVNEQDKNVTTALMAASWHGFAEVVRTLLAVPGINVNIQKDKVGWTALIAASSRGHIEIVKMLLAVPDVNVNMQNEVGWTALIAASRKGHVEIVKMLLADPVVNINLQDKDGCSALMSACLQGHVDVVRMLIAVRNINVDLKNNVGDTALNIAKNEEIKKLIDFHTATPATATNSTFTMPPGTTWLAARLLRGGMPEPLVLDCEQKLVFTEGFSSERDFAECLPTDFDRAYLKSIGITAMGVQVQLIRLQNELNAQYNQHAKEASSAPAPLPPAHPSPQSAVLSGSNHIKEPVHEHMKQMEKFSLETTPTVGHSQDPVFVPVVPQLDDPSTDPVCVEPL